MSCAVCTLTLPEDGARLQVHPRCLTRLRAMAGASAFTWCRCHACQASFSIRMEGTSPESAFCPGCGSRRTTCTRVALPGDVPDALAVGRWALSLEPRPVTVTGEEGQHYRAKHPRCRFCGGLGREVPAAVEDWPGPVTAETTPEDPP